MWVPGTVKCVYTSHEGGWALVWILAFPSQFSAKFVSKYGLLGRKRISLDHLMLLESCVNIPIHNNVSHCLHGDFGKVVHILCERSLQQTDVLRIVYISPIHTCVDFSRSENFFLASVNTFDVS